MAVFSYIIVASKIKEEFQEGVASLLELCLQILFAAASFTSEEDRRHIFGNVNPYNCQRK